ncbi:MAG: hypothetical protein V3V49_03890 [Candidatus Krumholzibacteria bacterium]
MKRSWVWPINVAVLILLLGASGMGLALAQDFDQASCDEFLHPKRVSNGKEVGPESCLMQETDVLFEGRTFRRLDIGLDGTVEGYLTKEGQYREYLTNAPDLVFPQTVDPGPVYPAIARYERDKGAAMTVLYPLDKSAWNGKMWVTAHGRGRSFKNESLRAWNKNLDRTNPLDGLNKYDKLMLSKGYVLVKTYRTSAEGLGEIEATLEDGTTVDYAAFNDTARYIMDFTEVAKKAIQRRLGRAPARTYLYGHSAGGRIGRGLNYTPGLNVGLDGKPAFDGILADDSAAGTWLPVVMTEGKDVLFATEAERQAFVPHIDVTHQMYNREWAPKRPDWVSSSFLQNKRQNAKILRDKGLTGKHRMYEIRSISHSGGENRPEGDVQTLNLSLLMDRFIDILDVWVDKGTSPPPTRSDWAELGDVNGDGVIEYPAISFPEVACPLGVYHQYPPGRGGPGSTFFAAFSGDDLEPLDSRGVFVDMNHNGIRDHRETPTQAWHRLGLLRENETLTQEKYGACVYEAAEQLRKDGFFSSRTAQWYLENAKKVNPKPKSLME